MFGLFAVVPVSAEQNEAVRLGKQLYHEGLLADGQPSQAIVQGDVAARGTQFTCVSCHRRSGLGTSEGGVQTPAVIGSILFAPIELRRRELHEIKIIRPAYNEETLKAAIRGGVGPSGDILDPLMPRYPLSDEDIDNLIAYFNSLNVSPDPGVTDDTVHFALVIAGPVDQEAVTAIQNVANHYFMGKNAMTRQEEYRAEVAPWYKDWHYESYRKWQLHTWTMTGEPSTWSAQLDMAYEKQPVFALVGGLGKDEWGPVNTFCNEKQVPCVLPSTLVAPDEDPDFYTLYFNAGVDLEARVLAKHIQLTDESNGACTILQIHDASGVSLTAAETLNRSLVEFGRNVETRSVGDERTLEQFDFRAVMRETDVCKVVLWLTDEKLDNLKELNSFSQIANIYLSASLATGTMSELSDDLRQKIRLVFPYQLKTGIRLNPRLSGWARGKKIELTHKRLQANTFYALNLTADAMQHIRSNFSRDYFLEKIEHMANRMLATPAYDDVGLAPGQRFLSKGAYVVRLPERPGEPMIPVSEWIVP